MINQAAFGKTVIFKASEGPWMSRLLPVSYLAARLIVRSQVLGALLNANLFDIGVFKWTSHRQQLRSLIDGSIGAATSG